LPLLYVCISIVLISTLLGKIEPWNKPRLICDPGVGFFWVTFFATKNVSFICLPENVAMTELFSLFLKHFHCVSNNEVTHFMKENQLVSANIPAN